MKNARNPYTVRLDTTDEKLRKFALAVSDALTRLSNVATTTVLQGEAIRGTTASWAIALYDEVSGAIAFLPGVRFVPIGANDVNVGFELDVSTRVGSGIGGTSQGYMANYGTVGGSKLAAGMSANNEDPNIPRLDLGFKPKRGATMEFYGSDGDTGNTRKGQLRATLGPTGRLVVTRYVSGETWEVLGGFGPSGELLCGYRNWEWPDATTGPVGASAPAVVNVYDQTDGTTKPVATIDKNGLITGKKVAITNGTNAVTLDPTGITGNITLTLQNKTFQDGSTAWVLCAASS